MMVENSVDIDEFATFDHHILTQTKVIRGDRSSSLLQKKKTKNELKENSIYLLGFIRSTYLRMY